MDLGLKGKKALVTGSGRGIGRAIVKALAKEGCNITVVDKNAQEIKNLMAELGGADGGHYGLEMDLMQRNAAKTLFDRIQKDFGLPNVLVHNLGGTLGVHDPLSVIEEWKKVWQFNLGFAIELNNLIIPLMQKEKWGRIVHVSSLAGVEITSATPYCAAKAALNAYIKGTAIFYAKDGVVISGVMPGAIKYGKPEDIADMIAFLSSEKASFCSGSLVPVDGGQGISFVGS